ncbi:nucleoside-diphosphate kinase [Streptococcus didelphis]|uniref:Nucleoside diphosphate kinase n=1 Tax=Streptococcus didelphis TaxID=102886 RepID=A0ABY9LH17_9STRE|nr:nucleoside-diphosphate kinase [Streptococcus didelphis]WMB28175.1 nucleoside-diphosphate kinase [Streptococcus didelphis]WMB30088.1 nucleoside-diphosphate kinase [Streptococcus didelphis]
MEKTFFMIKPDGVKRGLVGQVLSRIEQRGFIIEQLEMRRADTTILRKHYEALVDKPFFSEIETYMTSDPIVIGVLSGNRVVSSWRMMMGVTNPKDAQPGTIRGDFAQAPGDDGGIFNVVHGSDSTDSAKREIDLWFGSDQNARP